MRVRIIVQSLELTEGSVSPVYRATVYAVENPGPAPLMVTAWAGNKEIPLQKVHIWIERMGHTVVNETE